MGRIGAGRYRGRTEHRRIELGAQRIQQLLAGHRGAGQLRLDGLREPPAAYGEVEAGNVFTLELGVSVPDRGFVGLEEDVLVTPAGCVTVLPAPVAVRVSAP